MFKIGNCNHVLLTTAIENLQCARETEVKGQVKLMLTDKDGEDIVATRSLVSSQKVNLHNLGLCN